ncbi:MAG: hypothetical protein WA184_06895 [Stellaceae bacterium]
MRGLTLRARSGFGDGQPAAAPASPAAAFSSSAGMIENPRAASRGAGAILSLGVLAIAAAATVVAFFGIGFSLLIEHPAQSYRLPLATATVARAPPAPRIPPAEPKPNRAAVVGGTPAPSPKPPKPVELVQQARSGPAAAAAIPGPGPDPAVAKPAGEAAAAAGLAPSSQAPRAEANGASPARQAAAPKPPPAALAPAANGIPAEPRPATSLRLPTTELNTLLTQGDAAFREGDLTSARLYYLRAFGAGDGRGALGIGASYDPLFLRRFHLWTQHPDLAEARAWYVRAHDLGLTEAESRLDRLKTRLPR